MAVISDISVYRANPETLGFGSYQQSALSAVSIEKKYGGFVIFAKSHHPPACHGILGILKT